MRKTKIIFLLSILFAAPAYAGEETIRLKDSPGKNLVAANCSACHSLDYIQMNSVFLDRKGWEATMNKMIKVMGAPINESDVPEILDYLVKNYGLEYVKQ